MSGQHLEHVLRGQKGQTEKVTGMSINAARRLLQLASVLQEQHLGSILSRTLEAIPEMTVMTEMNQEEEENMTIMIMNLGDAANLDSRLI